MCGIWYRSVEKYGDQSQKTAKIEIRTPVKSDIYFRFVVSEISDVEPITSPSRVQNLVKIRNELQT